MTKPVEITTAPHEDFALGDVYTFGDHTTEFVVVAITPVVRFVPKDSHDARRVLAHIRRRHERDKLITESFKRRELKTRPRGE